MIFEKKTINLKDGRTGILRPVETKDAEAMIEYLRIVSSETPFLLRNEDEVTLTVEAEEKLLESKRNAFREIMMVAEVEGMIAGNCGISLRGNLRRVSHRCDFAIALKEACWNLGISAKFNIVITADWTCSLHLRTTLKITSAKRHQISSWNYNM